MISLTRTSFASRGKTGLGQFLMKLLKMTLFFRTDRFQWLKTRFFYADKNYINGISYNKNGSFKNLENKMKKKLKMDFDISKNPIDEKNENGHFKNDKIDNDNIKHEKEKNSKNEGNNGNNSNINKSPKPILPSDFYNSLVLKKRIEFNEKQFKIAKKLDNFSLKIQNSSNPENNKNNIENNAEITEKSFFSRMLKKFEKVDNKNNEKKNEKNLNGIYLFGPPGTGKTFLMDIFFKSLPIKGKMRTHFSVFMSEIHKKLHKIRINNKGVQIDMLKEIVNEIQSKNIVICFDEFQVTDIADAVILKRLFMLFLERGIFIIFTSNRVPFDLYKNGIQREEVFVPFINFLYRTCNVISLDTEMDYRATGTRLKELYFSPINDKNRILFQKAFQKVTNNNIPKKTLIKIDGRTLIIPKASNKSCIFSFTALCSKALGSEDYYQIALKFHTVFIENVPKLIPDESDVLRRFITMIDEFYQQKTRIVVLAETVVEGIFDKGNEEKTNSSRDEIFAWERCLSRLIEMQSKQYLDQAAEKRILESNN